MGKPLGKPCYYISLYHFKHLTLKCGGLSPDDEHRAFYIPYFQKHGYDCIRAMNQEPDAKGPYTVIVAPYQGNLVTLSTVQNPTHLNEWVRDAEWWGNPSLGLESWHKVFVNHLNNKKTKVYVYGKVDSWSFCVADGPNGDFSYTGSREGCKTAIELMLRLDTPLPTDQALFH